MREQVMLTASTKRSNDDLFSPIRLLERRRQARGLHDAGGGR